MSTLAVWSGRLPSIVEISVAAACALYAVHSWVQPFAMAWVPVAAMLTALAALQDELSLLAVALGPVPMIPSYESVTAAISGFTALTLAAVWGLRTHHTRYPATDPDFDLESDLASRL